MKIDFIYFDSGMVLQFYSLLFKGIKGKNNPAFIELCAQSKVRDLDRYSFYDDVKPVIQQLSELYKLGIISDGWPSLRLVYKESTMKDFFDPFIISSLYGYSKQQDELFEIALERCGVKADCCLFVDDNPGNCQRARNLGFNVLRMNRNGLKKNGMGIREVTSLEYLDSVLSL